jgi:N-acetylglucosamine kinase-like BadF-type ATPase
MLAGVLQNVFGTPKVEVQSDILGSVRAVCGRKPGIAGILGTGANSCQYDGEKVIDNVPVLGFILGDEGSAGYFGRKILQGYFYREMPEELKTQLESEFDMRRPVILENVYQKPQPNTYVAGFARFAGKHADHPYIKAILRAGLEECVDRHILKYRGADAMPVGFVGSVAYYNADLLREVLSEKGLIAGEIIKNPMPNLVKYHAGGLNR